MGDPLLEDRLLETQGSTGYEVGSHIWTGPGGDPIFNHHGVFGGWSFPLPNPYLNPYLNP